MGKESGRIYDDRRSGKESWNHQALEEKLDAKLYICDEAQLCGALGAALFAYEKCSV